MKPHDAIVVLGCRVGGDGALSPAAARRVKGAATLFEAGSAPIVVPSGGKRWAGAVEALAFAARLEAWGVPRDAVYPELSSLTTTENALYAAALVSRLVGTRPRLIVVTCSWHLPRALESFRRFGLHAEGFGVDPPAGLAAAWLRSARELASRGLDHLARARAGHRSERYAADHLGAASRARPR